MSPSITPDSPLAQALANAIQPKLVEMGWSEGQESPLIEYIVLMLVNGKTQQQIATELSDDFLCLDEGDNSAFGFTEWLFGQVEQLDQQINGGSNNTSVEQPVSSTGVNGAAQHMAYGQDAEMGEADSAM